MSPTIPLANRESIQVDGTGAISVLDSAGMIKQSSTLANGVAGTSYPIYKSGTASEAAAVFYSYAKDSGTPSSFVVVLANTATGNITDCSIYGSWTSPIGAGFMGSPVIPNPTSGSLYITDASLASTVANLTQLVDVVWYNATLSSTNTGLQNIPSFPTLPLRDLDGSSNGRGFQIALMNTVTLTNPGVISNSTISYTNSQGVSGRTATLDSNATSSIPATPVTGTWVPFKLQAGDQGVRSIQSFTLGTTMGGTGTPLQLIVYRPLMSIPNPVANVGGVMAVGSSNAPPGVRIYNGTCIWPIYLSSTTTATVTTGSVNVIER
jgi:hypothetical protein